MKNKQTFTKRRDQMKSKATKQRAIKERNQDEKDYVREALGEYRPHNKTLFL